MYGLLLVSGSHTHQENYARAFAADGRCRLVGLTDEADVSDRRSELNARLARELDVPLLEGFDEALARDDVHVVSVCAEPERRGRTAVRCAVAGRHVYIDKPLTTSVADARAVVDAVEKAGVKNQMFSLVHTAPGAECRRVVESGRIGELVGLHADLLFAKGPAGTADLPRPREERAADPERFTFLDSKRELYAIGVYPLVLFQWLTGKRFTSVSGATGNYFFKEHQQNDVEDFGCLLMEMEGGVTATVTAGRVGWQSHPSSGVHQVQLVGTEGVVTVDWMRPRLEVYADGPKWRPPEPPHPEDPMGFWSSTQEESGVAPKRDWEPIHRAVASDASWFIDCIEADRESDVPAALGAHAVEVILAGYESAAEDRTIEVTDRNAN